MRRLVCAKFSFLALTKVLLYSGLMLSTFYAQAQEQCSSEFALRAGYLHSITKVDQVEGYAIYTPVNEAKPGFYVGGQYQLKFGKRFISRGEVDFQHKGLIANVDYNGTRQRQVLDYNYIGITPTIGFAPLTNLAILVGPEFNFLLNNGGNGKSTNTIEYGLAARCSYQFIKFSVDIGYFIGLNEFRKTPEIVNHHYYNRNLQVGISYGFK